MRPLLSFCFLFKKYWYLLCQVLIAGCEIISWLRMDSSCGTLAGFVAPRHMGSLFLTGDPTHSPAIAVLILNSLDLQESPYFHFSSCPDGAEDAHMSSVPPAHVHELLLCAIL